MLSSVVIPAIQFLAFSSFYMGTLWIPNHEHESYDFVIIGGGTAGAITATKLSQGGKFKVLVLEEGGTPGNYFSEIPLSGPVVGMTTPEMNSLFLTTPQKHACGQSGGICNLQAGNGLGGGSTHNCMIYIRGSPLDYDEWNIKGWSWADLEPYFDQLEEKAPCGHTRANDPRICVSTPSVFPELQETLLTSLKDHGYKIGPLNHGDRDKFNKLDMAVRNGVRSSSWNEFLKPVLGRKNLNVETFAKVQKINFDEGNKRAISVSYLRHGVQREVKVGKEVILSAGACVTPQILMLSGIGDFKYLQEMGVQPLVMDLPAVGKHLKDHPTGVMATLTAGSTLIKESWLSDVETYYKKKKGPFSTTSIVAEGFLTDETSKNSNDTKVQILFFVDRSLKTLDLHLIAVLVDIESEGEIKLRSLDPDDKPIVDPALLRSEKDRKTYMTGIKKMLKFVASSKLLKEKGIKILPKPVIGCGYADEESLNDDTFLECVTRMSADTGWHQTSTARMGMSKDDSVVGPDLKVHSIKNLRILDASVMPNVPRGNTNSPASVIALYGSDMILKDHVSSKRPKK